MANMYVQLHARRRELLRVAAEMDRLGVKELEGYDANDPAFQAEVVRLGNESNRIEFDRLMVEMDDEEELIGMNEWLVIGLLTGESKEVERIEAVGNNRRSKEVSHLACLAFENVRKRSIYCRCL